MQNDVDLSNTNSTNNITIPVVEEEVTIGKEVVEKGTVRLSKKVHESLETYDVSLTKEEMVIERVPKNQIITETPPVIRQEGDITIIPVLKEVVVVEKRMMLVEEIRVIKKTTQTDEVVEVPVQREEVFIDRI